jgi:hypothetical protein
MHAAAALLLQKRVTHINNLSLGVLACLALLGAWCTTYQWARGASWSSSRWLTPSSWRTAATSLYPAHLWPHSGVHQQAGVGPGLVGGVPQSMVGSPMVPMGTAAAALPGPGVAGVMPAGMVVPAPAMPAVAPVVNADGAASAAGMAPTPGAVQPISSAAAALGGVPHSTTADQQHLDDATFRAGMSGQGP